MKLLDLFCGVGGWSRGFLAAGWDCVGVDLADFSYAYPGKFIMGDCCSLPVKLEKFDFVCASPPCEDFSRWAMPWLNGPYPASALSLLRYTLKLLRGVPHIVECSKFSARLEPCKYLLGSWALWGDVPVLLPYVNCGKTNKSGMRPDLRAEIPFNLSLHLAQCVSRGRR